MSVGSVIVGLLMLGSGILFTIKSEWFLQNFGSIEWAEINLGGGSRMFYKLFGALVAFLGILVVTGLWQGIVMGTLGRLFVAPTQR
jgi:hypothetical protein